MASTTLEKGTGLSQVDQPALKAFKSSIKGRVITPEDPDYDTVRKVYNGMIDKRPGMIVQCENIEDVFACVNFAREHHILLAIRGGGHNAGGLGICDEGLVIDFSHMKK
ncbi:MAG TPA: FAD-binding protein, partial [Chitinophagaceae bacterium]|nr:FAD-binding protein [Chitinophagaceae bacterium]